MTKAFRPKPRTGAVWAPKPRPDAEGGPLDFLDGMRGLAALYVVIGHARWLLWEGGEAFRQNAASYSAVQKAVVYTMSFFKYGHEMVLFFFVLSGFVIHLGNARRLSQRKPLHFNFGNFVLRRAKRLLPAYLFALLLTFVCDSIVAANAFSIYTHTLPHGQLNAVITFDHSAPTLLKNLFFLQTMHAPVYGSNGPLWSLAYEWWFYMLYPVLLFLSRQSRPLTVISLLCVTLLLLAGFKTNVAILDKVGGYLFSWWLGAVAADVFTKQQRLSPFAYGPLLLLVPAIPYLSGSGLQPLLRDNIVALGFFGLLLVVLKSRHTAAVRCLERLRLTGRFSYMLYVTHFPLLVLMNGMLLSFTGNVMPIHFLYVWLGVAVTAAFAYVMHFVLERPFVSAPKPKEQKGATVSATTASLAQ